MAVKLTHIAAVNPRLKMTQQEICALLMQRDALSQREKTFYRRFLSDKGILTRYFSVESVDELFEQEQDRLIRRFEREAPALSASSVREALAAAGLAAEDVDALTTVTCTGYLCPGLSSYIVERLGLRSDLYGADLVGMGCGGALPGLRMAWNQVSAVPRSHAVMVATEICSSAIHWYDEIELILSNSIFGDGSAACVVTGDPRREGLVLCDFEFKVSPESRDILRFTVRDSKLSNILKPDVPLIAAGYLRDCVSRILKRNDLRQADVSHWAVHSGGRKVLDAAEKGLSLDSDLLRCSRSVLARCGNMSSPTVLFVLADMLKEKSIKTGEYVIAASFGAGFTTYVALLRME